jgi:hypothetical protein
MQKVNVAVNPSVNGSDGVTIIIGVVINFYGNLVA